MMQNDVSEKYWSRFADTYDKHLAYVVGKDFICEIGKKMGKLPELGRTVAFGCGTGIFTKMILEKTTHLTATAALKAKGVKAMGTRGNSIVT